MGYPLEQLQTYKPNKNLSKMPNTGMLDHRAYQPTNTNRAGRSGTYVHWFSAWPSDAGYRTSKSYKVTSFSRHLIKDMQPQLNLQHQLLSSQSRPGTATPRTAMGNSISPFHTTTKPTCGYFFSRVTDNRKKSIGIPPSNLVAWRSSQRSHSAPVRGRTRTA